jgi:IS30 family transposase
MGQEQYSPAGGNKGSHFTFEQRRMLEWLWNGKGTFKKERSPTQLSALFGKGRRTIQRELKRGMVEHLTSELETVMVYNADYAQTDADGAKACHGPLEKIGHDYTLARAIGIKIKEERHSPYAAAAAFDRDGWPTDRRLCAKTIYRYVGKGMIEGVGTADLPRSGKTRTRTGKPPRHSRVAAIERSIDKRPAVANDRSEAGHWEMDSIKGPQNGSTACLLTLTERKTRAEIIRKLPDGSAASVVAALNGLERTVGPRFSTLFKSITSDNGVEFSNAAGMERSCSSEKQRLSLFYAHPYRASERGTNEHANGMIRRFFTKGTDFSLVSGEAIANVQVWMNRYPRKILGGSCPARSFPGLPPPHELVML